MNRVTVREDRETVGVNRVTVREDRETVRENAGDSVARDGSGTQFLLVDVLRPHHDAQARPRHHAGTTVRASLHDQSGTSSFS